MAKMMQKMVSLEPKQVSIGYIEIEEGLLYTNIYQALMFDQPCSSSRAVLADLSSDSELQKILARYLYRVYTTVFQSIISCSSHVGVHL